jgi:transcriptional regulator with XRE-family HTH domain
LLHNNPYGEIIAIIQKRDTAFFRHSTDFPGIFFPVRRCIVANIQLAYNLKRYREAYGFTQQALAERISISRQAYSNYETAKRDPDLDLLTKLCEVYSITLDQLVRTPFSEDEFRESRAPYHISYRSGTDDILYLTDEEIRFVLEYRGAEWERQHLVAYVLNHINPQGR